MKTEIKIQHNVKLPPKRLTKFKHLDLFEKLKAGDAITFTTKTKAHVFRTSAVRYFSNHREETFWFALRKISETEYTVFVLNEPPY